VVGKIYYTSALFNASGTGPAEGVTIDPQTGTVDMADSADTSDVNKAFLVLNSVEWPKDTLATADITPLTNWTGNKRLILTGEDAAASLNGALDVSPSGKGKLEIACKLDLAQYTLTGSAEGTGNITVTEAGSIKLSNAGGTLVGKIPVNGAINVSAGITTAAIPAEVDLTAATLTSGNDNAVLTLPNAARSIGTIDLVANNLEIAGPSGDSALSVVTVKNSGAKTLTLPPVTVSVERFETDSEGNTLTIAGKTSSMTLTAAPNKTVAVTGAGGLTLSNNVLVGTGTPVINIASGSNVTAATLTPLGTVADLAAKVSGAGTVDLATVPLSIGTALTFGPHITTSGDVTLTANATFNQGLSAPVINTGADGTVTLTLNGAESTLTTLNSAVVLQTLALAGTGNVTVSGIVTAAGNLEVNSTGIVSFAVNDATNTLATGKSLTVGSSSSVKAGTFLTFGPGKYTAGGTNGFSYGNSILKATSVANDILALGTEAENKLTLGGTDTSNVTFTASGAMVTLSGAGVGSITVLPAPGALALGEKADLKLGDGTVALGSGGKLSLVSGSKISGFSDTTNTTVNSGTGMTAGFTGTGYTSGVDVPAAAGVGLSAGVITGAGDGGSFVGTAPTGGILAKGSAIGKTQ
jgi:filamentous hemagglutinin